MANITKVRQALLNVPAALPGSIGARVDIVEGGLVRLRLSSGAGTRDLFCDTLEERPLLATVEAALDTDVYGQLLWELDLRGLRGE